MRRQSWQSTGPTQPAPEHLGENRRHAVGRHTPHRLDRTLDEADGIEHDDHALMEHCRGERPGQETQQKIACARWCPWNAVCHDRSVSLLPTAYPRVHCVYASGVWIWQYRKSPA